MTLDDVVVLIADGKPDDADEAFVAAGLAFKEVAPLGWARLRLAGTELRAWLTIPDEVARHLRDPLWPAIGGHYVKVLPQGNGQVLIERCRRRSSDHAHGA